MTEVDYEGTSWKISDLIEHWRQLDKETKAEKEARKEARKQKHSRRSRRRMSDYELTGPKRLAIHVRRLQVLYRKRKANKFDAAEPRPTCWGERTDYVTVPDELRGEEDFQQLECEAVDHRGYHKTHTRNPDGTRKFRFNDYNRITLIVTSKEIDEIVSEEHSR